jgi:hypothetical protein
VYCSRVRDKVLARPGKADEEFRRKQVALEPVAPGTGKDDVPGRVGAAPSERVNVVESGEVEF